MGREDKCRELQGLAAKQKTLCISLKQKRKDRGQVRLQRRRRNKRDRREKRDKELHKPERREEKNPFPHRRTQGGQTQTNPGVSNQRSAQPGREDVQVLLSSGPTCISRVQKLQSEEGAAGQ